MANQPNGVVSATNDIERRVAEHKQGLIEGFTKEYGVNRLVHLELFFNITDAIRREKQLKKWNREWKVDLSKGKSGSLLRPSVSNTIYRSCR